MKKAIALAAALLMANVNPALAKNVKINAVGDVSVCKIYQKSIDTEHDWMLDKLADVEKKDGLESAVAYPFRNVKQYFPADDNDINFCNLEGAYAVTKTAEQRADKTFAIFMPEKYLDALKLFNIVSLANNHAMDYKNTGLYNTTYELKKRNVTYVGAGKNLDSARKGKIIEKDGVKVGFLAYNMVRPSYIYATEKTPGTNGSLDEKVMEEYLKTDIPELKKEADFVVVSFHWGDEGSHNATETQKTLAHLAVDSGASLVIGHHPHVLQEAEMYKNKLIAYSLGNFVFGGSYSKENGYTAIMQAELDDKGKIVSYKFVPVNSNKVATKFSPAPFSPDSEKAKKVYKYLNLNDEGKFAEETVKK